MKKQSSKKLVEILAVELKEWPEGAHVAVQDNDSDRTIWCLEHRYESLEFNGQEWVSDCCFDILISTTSKLADDYATAIVTREMWEAERAKLEGEKVMRACVEKCEPESKPKANGWVRNRGRKNPFDVCTLVDARLRSGEVVTGKFSENLHWVHTGNNFDVMAYRVNESVEAETPEVTAPVDGPLQWRDRVNEIDRTVEALEEERASLIQKLAGEGFKLIKREAVELPDMSDWRNWREGDMVEIIDDGGWRNPVGNVYAIQSRDNSEMPFVVNGIWYRPEMLKFHSRPTK